MNVKPTYAQVTEKMCADFVLPIYKGNYIWSAFPRSHQWSLSGNSPFLSVCLCVLDFFFVDLLKGKGEYEF
jgi:hypothetical protein